MSSALWLTQLEVSTEELGDNMYHGMVLEGTVDWNVQLDYVVRKIGMNMANVVVTL